MADSKREWMIGHQGHTGLLTVEEVATLIRGGQLREQEMVKRQGQPWRAAREVPELAAYFKNPGHGAMTAAIQDAPAPDEQPIAPPPPDDRTILYPAPSVTPAKPEAKPAAAKPAVVAEKPTRFRRLASYRGTDRKEAPKPAAVAPAAASPAPAAKAGASPPLDVDVKGVVEEAEKLSADSSASYPAIKEAPTEAPTAEHAAPSSHAAAPPAKAEAKPEPKAAPKQPSRRALKAVPPPAPTLPPMTAKYYSPAELVRDTSLAFSVRKLGVVFGLLLPTFFLSSLLFACWKQGVKDSPTARSILDLIPYAILALGTCAAMASSTYLTRRELEGQPTTGLMTHVARVLPGLFGIVVAAGVAYGAMRGVLWILGWIRNLSTATAAILRFLEILPLLFAALAVGLALIGGIAAAYAAAAAAVEGCTPIGGVKHIRSMARDQGRRFALHVFVIAVVAGAAAAACGYLVQFQMWPLIHAKPPTTPEQFAAWQHWDGYWGVGAFYEGGVMLALIAAIPMSLLGTMTVLSYGALRQPEGAQLPATGRPDETSQNEAQAAAEKPAPTAMEQTTPSATRPGEEKVEDLPEPDVQPSTSAPPPAPAPPASPPAGST
jgi:hypothetical protein